MSPAMVVDAESAAGRIFSAAGLELEWINCGDSNEPASVAQHCTEVTYPTHLQLRILFRPRNLTASTLGISYLDEKGSGCYSEIFATQADDLALDSWFRAVLLGHVMAHEIGHLLLGTNSHSPLGLMRAHWEAVDLERAAKGQLLFTAQESERMKRRAQTASAKRETASAD